MSDNEPTSDVAVLTVQLLSAYLANNSVASENLAELIRSTKAALTDGGDVAATQASEAFVPAVSVRKSLASPEHIISLIDGRAYKTLKRHLASHGLTPETYRTRYNLPASYPMVAPAYAAHRRDVAQQFGLGTKKPAAQASESLVNPAEDESTEAPVAEAPVDAVKTAQPKSASTSKKRGTSKSKRAVPQRDEVAEQSNPVEPHAETTPVAEASNGSSAAGSETYETPAPERAKPVRTKKSTADQAADGKPRASKDTSKLAASPTSQTDEAAIAADPVDDVEEQASAPKRRAKIGLFSKSDAQNAEPSEAAALPADDAKDATSPKKPASQKKPKRMARPPETTG